MENHNCCWFVGKVVSVRSRVTGKITDKKVTWLPEISDKRDWIEKGYIWA